MLQCHNVLVLPFLVVFSIFSCNGQDFGYDGSEGPIHWGEKYQQCVGKHQSPIDIESQNVIEKSFPPIVYDGFDQNLEQVNVTNNGHTVMLSITKGEPPTVSGGPLSGTYAFTQLHFHWGQNDSLGSENQINHQSFPLELHVVLYNIQYETFKNALDYEDGLVVLSFLYSVSHTSNSKYNQFEEALDAVRDILASKEIDNFVSLDDFVGIDRGAYFTYAGSLTTPPCSEVVTWIEYQNTIPVSREQVSTNIFLFF